MPNPKEPRVVAVILGGGKGTRLYPLTKDRSKPAVPFGGKYRIVDIPISNCINSGYRKIFLLTQFNSASLHHHITNTYNFDRFGKGFVEILAAEQTPEHSGWFEGTADAVRKNLVHFRTQRPTHYVILSGDQLYRMNLKDFMDSHIKSGAEITIATIAVNERDATGFGIMKIDGSHQIKEFVEKPSVETLKSGGWKIPESERGDLPKEKEYLASMGIYIFNAETMEQVLDNEDDDFGKKIIPAAIKTRKVNSYVFDGYWEDIGTIRSFYEATLALTDYEPDFDFYDADEPIYTHMRYLPPSKINDATIENSITTEGCIISKAKLKQSVVGVRSLLEVGVDLDGVIVMGADYYENEETKAENKKAGRPNIGIGKNCKIKKTIIDKNAAIGADCRINVDGKTYPDGENTLPNGVSFYSSDGIIVIRKGSVIPSGTVI